jgi:ATP-dependent Clp protease ATP-binding subunit ClpB
MSNLRLELSDLLKRTIRPEFLNRVDDIILFKPLLKEEVRKIVDIQINRTAELLKEKNIQIEVSEEAKDWLAQLGYDVVYGARPLKRTIQRYLVNPLAQALLSDEFVNGDKIYVSLNEKGTGLAFSKK